MLPVLVSKALADAGYDLIEPRDDGWFLARVSGSHVVLAVRPGAAGTRLWRLRSPA
jgi:hypothetical protein